MSRLYPAESFTPERRHRRRTRLAAVVVLLAVVVVGLSWVWLGRGEGEWERYVKEVEARGDSLDWKTYLPSPAPPDAENFAANSVLRAAGVRGRRDTNKWPVLLDLELPVRPALVELGDWTKGGRADLVRAAKMMSPASAGSADLTRAEAASALLAAFAPAETEITELRRASLRPGAKVELVYTDPGAAELPDFVAFRELAQLFTMRANAEVELGRMDEAFADIRVIHRLAETLELEPNLVSAMIAVAIHGIAPQAFWQGWVEGKWSDAQLLAFQERFEQVDLLPSFDRVMRGERAGVNHMVNDLSRPRLAEVFGSGGGSLRANVAGFMMWLSPGAFLRSNRLLYNRLLDRAVFNAYDVAGRRVFPKLVDQGSAEISRVTSRFGVANWLATVALPNSSRALETTSRNQMMIRLAAVACMLERHRRAKGGYPERLEDLTPEFAAQLPIDLITGSPPVYRRADGGGFLLYCVGWDERDDGGDPARDWVWPMGRGAGQSEH